MNFMRNHEKRKPIICVCLFSLLFLVIHILFSPPKREKTKIRNVENVNFLCCFFSFHFPFTPMYYLKLFHLFPNFLFFSFLKFRMEKTNEGSFFSFSKNENNKMILITLLYIDVFNLINKLKDNFFIKMKMNEFEKSY